MATYPNFQGQVGSIEEHNVACQDMFVVLRRNFSPRRSNLLFRPAFYFPPAEKSEHGGEGEGAVDGGGALLPAGVASLDCS